MTFRAWLNAWTRTRPHRRATPTLSRSRRKQAVCKLSVLNLDDRIVPAFLGPINYAVGAGPQAVVTANFNGGGADIAVANVSSNSVSVLLGDSLGGFGAKTDFATGANPHSLVVGDVSGDGKLDLVTANAGDVSILRGDGAGNFAMPDSIVLPGQFPSGYPGTDPLAQAPHSVATGDFNGDGLLDLAVTGVTAFQESYTGYYGGTYYRQVYNAYANVLISNGSGGFNAAVATPLSGLFPDSVVTGRFNADTRDDLAVANNNSSTVSVLLSNGAGGFSSSADFYTGSGPSSVVAGDVNGDLKIDLVVANRSGYDVSVLLGNGSGGFGAAKNYAVGNDTTSVALGDINADGKLDLVTSSNFYTQTGDYYTGYSGYYTGQVNVLLGYGNGVFASPTDHVLAAGTFATGVAVGNFNGDGFPDVAVTYSNLNNVSVLINDQSWPPPPPPTVSIGDATVTEGNTGTRSATFTVSLSFVSNVDVKVQYATADASATAGSDYANTFGEVTIPAGQSSSTFAVAVAGDRVWEPTETFVVNLSAPFNATIGNGQGVGTILDDEPLISISDVTVTEANTTNVNATFTVTLSAIYDQDVTVPYATANGTATAGSDYTAASGNVTIPAGQISRTIAVAVLGDRIAESTETFVVNLSAPVNGGIADGQGIGTIVDNEPRISINNVAKKEGNSGTTQFIFTVTLSAAYDQAVTVNYATANGTATAGSDYTAKNGTLTFAPGVTSMTITINVTGDKTRENDESFFVNLSGASSNAFVAVAQGICTILDDDNPPGKRK